WNPNERRRHRATLYLSFVDHYQSEGASNAAYSHRLQVVAAATACCHEMKLKVARRASSKVHYISKIQKHSISHPLKTASSPPSTSPEKVTSTPLMERGRDGDEGDDEGWNLEGQKVV
ncbi:hypothetical protein AKJ16_DCAP20666, partial [Drosera capensis]